jgi:putative addiction module component (TIGR02574 family)
MIAPRERIVRDALKLPEEERVRVVQDLLDSLSPEASDMLDDAWAEELDRRFAAWEADPSAGVPWSELKSQTMQPSLLTDPVVAGVGRRKGPSSF